MTDEELLKKINDYAEKVLADVDPQKVRISVQLDKLRPVMEEISKETGTPLEDIFIKYMDLASDAGVSRENQFKEDYKDVLFEKPLL